MIQRVYSSNLNQAHIISRCKMETSGIVHGWGGDGENVTGTVGMVMNFFNLRGGDGDQGAGSVQAAMYGLALEWHNFLPAVTIRLC